MTEDLKILSFVRMRAGSDNRFQWHLRCLKHYEQEFYNLRDSLDENQQALLDNYLDASEELNMDLIQTAYKLGREEGIKMTSGI